MVQFHARLAPYKVALVCNGTKATTHIREVADHLATELRQAGLTVLDLQDTTSPMETQYTMYVVHGNNRLVYHPVDSIPQKKKNFYEKNLY